MADITGTKISELPAASSAASADVLAGVQSSTTKKFSLAVLLAWIKAQITPADIGAVPTSRTINGNALTGNIVLDAEDVGAASVDDLDNVAAAIPTASDADPVMDGTASPGSAATWARGDHVHPIDTGRAAVALGNNFGVCSTAGSTAAKEVTIPGITELVDGLSIRVLFEQTLPANATLNVNNLGAHPMNGLAGTALPANVNRPQEVLDFVYYNSSWIAIDEGTATTVYYGLVRLTSSVSSTSVTLAATGLAVKTAYDAATTNLAPVEASSTASANYAVGEHLVLDGVLYEVTAAIASGETITPGTNVSATTVTGITNGLDTRVDALETALDGLVSQLSQV